MHDVPPLITRAFEAFDQRRSIVTVTDLSAAVSTNAVYRVGLDDGAEVFAKLSSYGSYFHFRQDHLLIHQWASHLVNTPFEGFLAPVLEKDGQAFTYREGHQWVALYGNAGFYNFLPKVLSAGQVDALGKEMAGLHSASARAAPLMDSSWKSVGSDVSILFDSLDSREFLAARELDAKSADLLKTHCEAFMENSERIGYHDMPRIPVLIDWNITNFSVGMDGDGFKFYSRWDYDWFRVEPRVLDFYFAARVVRAEGDKTAFSYSPDPFFDDRFLQFLSAYHKRNPLEERDIRYLGESYRFFLLNYVIRIGEHFFRDEYRRRLQREVVATHLPTIQTLSFEPLLAAIK